MLCREISTKAMSDLCLDVKASLAFQQDDAISARLHRSDYAFIEGELKVARGGISTLQTDSEFAVDTKWEDFGGSHCAARYFKMDEDAVTLDGFSSRCSKEEEAAAHEMCLKHVGNHRVDDQTFFADCVYDVCHGAGEIAAELAAELLASTLAIEGA